MLQDFSFRHMHSSGGVLAHFSTENDLQILLEKCSTNLFFMLWSLVLSLDFPFGFSLGGWLFILLLWRHFWLHALGHCSVHFGVIFSGSFLSPLNMGCVPAAEEFSFGIRLDSPQYFMGFSNYPNILRLSARSTSNHHGWVMIIVPQVLTETFRNPLETSVFGRSCKNYLVELVMTPLRPLLVRTEPANINLH